MGRTPTSSYVLTVFVVLSIAVGVAALTARSKGAVTAEVT